MVEVLRAPRIAELLQPYADVHSDDITARAKPGLRKSWALVRARSVAVYNELLSASAVVHDSGEAEYRLQIKAASSNGGGAVTSAGAAQYVLEQHKQKEHAKVPTPKALHNDKNKKAAIDVELGEATAKLGEAQESRLPLFF